MRWAPWVESATLRHVIALNGGPKHTNDAFSDKTIGPDCAIACGPKFGIFEGFAQRAAYRFRGHRGTAAAVQIVQEDFIRSARSVGGAGLGLSLGLSLGGAAALAAAIATTALVADAGHGAAAQGRFEAEYTATLAGIPIGRGDWVIEISDDQFTATASGGTFGIVRLLTQGHGVSTAQGPLNGGQPVPQSYVSTITNDKRVDDVRMAFAGGSVKELSVEPPFNPSPDRIPVTDADRHNVLDPMTATLVHVGGSGDPVSPQACDRRVAVFDGRVRYELHSEFKRMETVKADRGYSGPAVVCAVYFTPISGYVPNRPAIKYLVELRDAEVWLAPIAGTRVAVPFRFSMPTPLGVGLLQATEFVSVAPQARAAVKTQ